MMMLTAILTYIEATIYAMMECVLIVPRQLGYFTLLYICWALSPKSMKVIIRSVVIRSCARTIITLYNAFKYPIIKVRNDIERAFGPRAIEAIEKLLSVYAGYGSIEDMINTRVYKYIHLGGKLDDLGDYKLIDINGRSKFVPIDRNERDNKYSNHLLVFVDRNGMKYDITPYGKAPDDLPDGEYQLMTKTGAEYRLVGIYSNPNEITIKARRF